MKGTSIVIDKFCELSFIEVLFDNIIGSYQSSYKNPISCTAE